MLPKARIKTLHNRVRIVSAAIPQSELITIMIAVRAGARGETKGIRGISHVLEHQVFKGSENFCSPQDLNEAIASIGATYNAATNMEYTYFIIEAPKEHGIDALEILADAVLKPRFPEDEFSREKKVVLEEVLRAKAEDSYYLSILFEDLMYQHQPLGWDINGTMTSVRGLTRRQVQTYHRNWYTGNRMAVALVGAGNLKKIEKRTSELFRSLPVGKARKWKPFARKKEWKRRRHLKRNEDLVSLIVGTPGLTMRSSMRPAQAIIEEALSGVTSSRLYDRLREREGMVYEIFGGSEYYSDGGHFSVSTQTDPKHADKVLAHILEEFERMKVDPLSTKEFRIAKASIRAGVSSVPENHEAFGVYLLKQLLFSRKIVQLAEYQKMVAAMDIGAVRRLSRELFRKKDYVVASLGPKQPRLPRKLII